MCCFASRPAHVPYECLNIHSAMAGHVDLNRERFSLLKFDWRQYAQTALGNIEDTGSNAVATSENSAVESALRAQALSLLRHD